MLDLRFLYINFFIIQRSKCSNITILVQNIYEVVLFHFFGKLLSSIFKENKKIDTQLT